MDPSDLVNRFKFHPANSEAKAEAHEYIREAFGNLSRDLNTRIPEGREKAIAITKMEEAMFWANAALARAGS
jgi:hypothetical protein